jgi:hypothetical protein
MLYLFLPGQFISCIPGPFVCVCGFFLCVCVYLGLFCFVSTWVCSISYLPGPVYFVSTRASLLVSAQPLYFMPTWASFVPTWDCIVPTRASFVLTYSYIELPGPVLLCLPRPTSYLSGLVLCLLGPLLYLPGPVLFHAYLGLLLLCLPGLFFLTNLG